MANPARYLERQQLESADPFPRLGRIFKGGKKQTRTRRNKKTGQVENYQVYGDDLDYFRFEPKDPTVGAAIREIYGEAPRSINILLIDADPDKAFRKIIGACGAGNVYVRLCNGTTITDERDYSSVGKGRMLPTDKPCFQCGTSECSLPKDRQCSLRGILRFAIPELLDRGIWGYFDISLGGEVEVPRIDGRLAGLLQDARRIKGVPLRLFRAMEQSPSPYQDKATGQWKRTTKMRSLVDIAPQPHVSATLGLLQSQQATQYLEAQVTDAPPLNAPIALDSAPIALAPAQPSQKSSPEDQANLVLLELYGNELRDRFPEFLALHKRRYRVTLAPTGDADDEAPLTPAELPHVVGRICLAYANRMNLPGMTKTHDADIELFKQWCANPQPLAFAKSRDFVAIARLWKVEVGDRLAAEELAMTGGAIA